MNTTSLGHRVSARRKRKGISQRQLATTVGLTVSQVSRIEGGRRMPPLDTFLRIAAAIGAAPAYLLEGLEP
jgi:transcriptional regulator with XRE-family HTH domain